MTTAQERAKPVPASDVKMAAQGDEAAFARLIEAHEGMLYRVSRTVLNSEADCADAVQETVIAAWRRIGQLRDAERFPAWAARICVNQCYRLLRRRGRAEATVGEPAYRADRDARLDAMAAIRALPERMRLPAALYYFEDWSVEEIALALGTLKGTVKSRLFTARRLLAEQLKDYKEETRDETR